MSAQVRITATGDIGLSIELMLGDENRAWRDLEPGESVDLGVGGNQTLVIDLPREAATPFITPEGAEPKPWVTGDDGADVPVGVDVTAEDEGREAPAEVPAEVPAEEAEPEKVEVGTGEVGDLGALFGGVDESEEAEEAEDETVESVINTLEADSPLEVGSLSDLPSPFDAEEEAEDTGDEKAQA